MPESKPSRPRMVKVLVTAPGLDLETAVPLLERHGLHVDTVLEAIGVISGRVTEAGIPQLEKIKGITVERDQSATIGPPGATES